MSFAATFRKKQSFFIHKRGTKVGRKDVNDKFTRATHIITILFGNKKLRSLEMTRDYIPLIRDLSHPPASLDLQKAHENRTA